MSVPSSQPLQPDRTDRAVVGAVDLRLRRTELLLIFGFWFLMAGLSALGAVLDPRGRMAQPGPIPGNLLVPFIEYGLWALVTPAVFSLAARVGPDRPRRFGGILSLAVLGIIVAMAADVIFSWLRFDLFAPQGDVGRGAGGGPPGVLDGLLRFWFLDDLGLYLAILGAGLARAYSLRLRARHEQAVLLEAETARLNAQLAEARLASLRTQLDPHFLFNTLNAVSALVERDPGGVRRMIARLSELLRWSLEGADSAEITVRQELDVVRRYLEIMQVRFQGGLEVDVRAEPGVEDALVPTLILQLLVENSIKHGIEEGEPGGSIEVVASIDGSDLVLEVLDEGPGSEGPVVPRVGLRNVQERLDALYGDAAGVELSPRAGGGMRAEVRLPYHTADDLRVAGADGGRA